MAEQYFIIHNSDGDTSVKPTTKEQFLKDIADGDYDLPISGVTFIEDLDDVENLDTNYWPENSYLIIKGKIVTPKPKEIVTEYEIE